MEGIDFLSSGGILNRGPAQDAADLLDVIGVMACHVGSQGRDCDASALGVYAAAVPLLWGQPFQEMKVCVAEKAEECERFFGIAATVVAETRPEVLIEAGQSNPAVLHHLAITPCGGDLVFGEVRENLADRPFFGTGSGREPLRCHTGDEFREKPR